MAGLLVAWHFRLLRLRNRRPVTVGGEGTNLQALRARKHRRHERQCHELRIQPHLILIVIPNRFLSNLL